MSIRLDFATTHDGARIFYSCASGSGTPLVFADEPGYVPVSGQLRLQSDLAACIALAGGAPWYLFDWRGKGRSSRIENDLTMDDLVADLVAVSRVVGEPFDLYAWARAVHVAVAFATKHPERVRRLLLVTAERVEGAGVRPLADHFTRMWRADPLGTVMAHLRGMHEQTSVAEIDDVGREWHQGLPSSTYDALLALFDGHSIASSVAGAELPPTLLLAMPHELEAVLETAACVPGAVVAECLNTRSGPAQMTEWRQLWDEYLPMSLPPTTAAPARTCHSFGLSDREREVLQLVAHGLSNAELAERLTIAPTTAARHVANIFLKLGVTNRGRAIAIAYENGLAGTSAAPRRAG